MSSHIEYRHLAIAFPTTCLKERWEAETGEPLWSHPTETIYIVLVESGESNCTVEKWINGRRREVLARRWRIGAIGSLDDVIDHACRIAPFVNGGSTLLGSAGSSGCVLPEQYIGHYRRTVARAIDKSQLPIAGRLIRFNDPELKQGRCPWLSKARETGRLADEPCTYLPGRSTPVLQLSESVAGSLACDVHALAGVFRMRGNDYPHFDFHGSSIDWEIDQAYDRMMRSRKRAA